MAKKVAQGGFVGCPAEGAGAPFEAHDGGLDGGRRPKAGARDDFDGLNGVMALHQDGEQAVIPGGGGGHQAVGHFALDGDHHARGGMGQLGQADHQAGGDGIGQVRHQFDAGAIEQGGQVAVERVVLDQGQFGVGVEPLAQPGGQTAIFFDGDDRRDSFEERPGQHAKAGAHFKDAVGGDQLGGIQQNIQNIAVDEKVLSEDARWMEVHFSQERADLRGAGQLARRGHGQRCFSFEIPSGGGF